MNRQTRIRTLAASGNTTRSLPKYMVCTLAVWEFIKGVFNTTGTPKPHAEHLNIDEMTRAFDESLKVVRKIVNNADSKLASIAKSKHKQQALEAATNAIKTLVSGHEDTLRETVATETQRILSVIEGTLKKQHRGLTQKYQILSQFQQSQSRSEHVPELPSQASIKTKIDHIFSECSEHSASVPGFLQRFLKPSFNLPKFDRLVTQYYQEVEKEMIDYFVTELQTEVLAQVEGMLSTLDAEIEQFQGRLEDLEKHAHQATRNFSGYDKARGDVHRASKALARRALHDAEFVDAVYTFVSNQQDNIEIDAILWHFLNEIQKKYDDCIPQLMDMYTSPLNTVQSKREAEPYVEMNSEYENDRLHFNGNLFRYNITTEDRQKTVNNRANKHTEIPNIRALYNMEIGFTMNDMLVYPHLERAYQELTDMDEIVHIHKDPEFFTQASIDRFASQEQTLHIVQQRSEDITQDVTALVLIIPRLSTRDRELFSNVEVVRHNSNGSNGNHGTQLYANLKSQHGVFRKYQLPDEIPQLAETTTAEEFIRTNRQRLKLLLTQQPVDNLPNIVSEALREMPSREVDQAASFFANYFDTIASNY